MNVQYEKVKLLNFQEIASFLFIISIFISIYLQNNEKKNILNMFYKDLSSLEEFNRYFIIALLVVFLYINYNFFNIAKYQNKKIKPYIIQNYATLLSLIAGFLALYAFYENKRSISSVESPVI